VYTARGREALEVACEGEGPGRCAWTATLYFRARAGADVGADVGAERLEVLSVEVAIAGRPEGPWSRQVRASFLLVERR
jgi:hypothetical protein